MGPAAINIMDNMAGRPVGQHSEPVAIHAPRTCQVAHDRDAEHYSGGVASPQALRISAAARLFTVLALAGPIMWSREPGSLFALFAIALIWLNGVLTQWRPHLRCSPWARSSRPR